MDFEFNDGMLVMKLTPPPTEDDIVAINYVGGVGFITIDQHSGVTKDGSWYRNLTEFNKMDFDVLIMDANNLRLKHKFERRLK